MTTTTVVVPDATRPLDFDGVLRPVLEGIEDNVTVLVGLGLHRPMTAAELSPLTTLCSELGASLKQHDPEATVVAPSGARFAREVVETDCLVCVGVVEPHQYAGYSGGVKGIVIGCGSHDLISQMHSLPMLRANGARVGWLDGNPFQERLRELAEGLPPTTGVFCVPGTDEIFEGPVLAAFDRAVERSSKLHFEVLDHPVESMLLRVSGPKAVNFYQASRAATYVCLAGAPAIRVGGTLYLDAACPEGIGKGAGEQACDAAMRRGQAALLADLSSDSPPDVPGGSQRAYVLAMALERARIVLVGAPPLDSLARLGITQRSSRPTVDYVSNDPFHAVPVLGR